MSGELEAIKLDDAPRAEAAPGVQTEQAAPPPSDPAAEWAELPRMFGSILSTFKPLRELREVYTPQACIEWGQAMAPLAAQYGWTAAGALAWLGPWVRLAVATHSLAMPTVDLIKQRMAEAKAAREKKPEPAPAPQQ